MIEPTSELEWLRGYRRLLEDGIQAGEVELFKLRKENADLCEENSRLRSCLSDDTDNARQIMGENAWLLTQLEDVIESMGRVEERCAKLRELVLDMWNDMSVCYEQHVRISSSDMRFYGERIHELGIEVDDGTE